MSMLSWWGWCLAVGGVESDGLTGVGRGWTGWSADC